MEKSRKPASSQKKTQTSVTEVLSVPGLIPGAGNPADAKADKQTAAAASATAAVPVLGDPADALKKAADAAETSEDGLLDWVVKFIILILLGKMKIGAKKVSPNKFVPKQKPEKTDSELTWEKLELAVKGTNPNYSTGKYEWTNNCQRCVSAFEARMRGENVVAKPTFQGDRFGVLSSPDGYVHSVYESPQILDKGGDTGLDCQNKIVEQMNEWGDGARAIVRVRWADELGGGGHVFNAVQMNGETHFVDPQTGSMDCSKYFNGIKPSETKLIRNDNLAFKKEGINKCKQ